MPCSQSSVPVAVQTPRDSLTIGTSGTGSKYKTSAHVLQRSDFPESHTHTHTHTHTRPRPFRPLNMDTAFYLPVNLASWPIEDEGRTVPRRGSQVCG